jgi:hypothetical protein
MSKKLQPAARTSISTAPARSGGGGISATRRSRGSIRRSTTIARISAPIGSEGGDSTPLAAGNAAPRRASPVLEPGYGAR